MSRPGSSSAARWLLAAAAAEYACVTGARAADVGVDLRLAKSVETAATTLGEGLRAASSLGRPVAAQFELVADKLQLLVQVENDEVSSDIAIEPESGEVRRTVALGGNPE